MSTRQFYLRLAARKECVPIGTDLILHEDHHPEEVRNDGAALGRVVEQAARRWKSPLAVPLMDLRLEKIDVLALAGIPAGNVEGFHFPAPLDDAQLAPLCNKGSVAFCPGSAARNEAITHIAGLAGLLPVGMCIGPFSLATRLMSDPIGAAALAGTGVDADESDEVKLLFQCLQISESAVHRSVRSQVEHGARAMMICEPTACTAFISPRQLKSGSKIFERLVMEPNLRLKALLDKMHCDLIFHDCGELIDSMVEAFAHRLHPVVLSLGSSRRLWEDARLVPKDVVLYGNLPSKAFYSDSVMPVEEVVRRTQELVDRMAACGHPHIVGSECDVLFVPEAEKSIRRKVDAMMGQTLVCN